MRPEQVKILLFAAGVAVALALYLVHHLAGRRRSLPSASGRTRRSVPANGATVRFAVGKAYWCRDKGWGDTASEILRRTEKKVLISCDVIEKRSDVTVWRSIRVENGVETLERGKIRADDEYTGKRGLAPSYAAAKGV